jgi:hypothetical protein
MNAEHTFFAAHVNGQKRMIAIAAGPAMLAKL